MSCEQSMAARAAWVSATVPAGKGRKNRIIWGEFDTGTTEWNVANPQPKATHDMRWAGLFSPIGMAPIDWYYNFQSAAFLATKYKEAKIASDFFKGLDYAGKRFTYLSTGDVRLTSEAINTSNAQLRVLAMRANGGTEAYAWVQNKGQCPLGSKHHSRSDFSDVHTAGNGRWEL